MKNPWSAEAKSSTSRSGRCAGRCALNRVNSYLVAIYKVEIPWSRASQLSIAESCGRASLRFRRFNFSVSRRRAGLQRMQKSSRDRRHLINGSQEVRFVRLGWLMDSADFAYEL